MRVVTHDPPPTSLLSADEMVSAINVVVHVKASAAVARHGQAATPLSGQPVPLRSLQMPPLGGPPPMAGPSTAAIGLPGSARDLINGEDTEEEEPSSLEEVPLRQQQQLKPPVRVPLSRLRRSRAPPQAEAHLTVPSEALCAALAEDSALEHADAGIAEDPMSATGALPAADADGSADPITDAATEAAFSLPSSVVAAEGEAAEGEDDHPAVEGADQDNEPAQTPTLQEPGQAPVMMAIPPIHLAAEGLIAGSPTSSVAEAVEEGHPLLANNALPTSTLMTEGSTGPGYETLSYIALGEGTGLASALVDGLALGPSPRASPLGEGTGLGVGGAGANRPSLQIGDRDEEEEEEEQDPLILQLLQRAAISNRRSPSPALMKMLSTPDGGALPLKSPAMPRGARALLLGGHQPSEPQPAVPPSACSESDYCSRSREGDGAGNKPTSSRGVWVRDAVFDPSGASNPVMAGMLTRAARRVMPGTTVELPEAACGAPPAPALQPSKQQKQEDVEGMLARFALLSPSAAMTTGACELAASTSTTAAAAPRRNLGSPATSLGGLHQGSGAFGMSSLVHSSTTAALGPVRARRRPLAFRKVTTQDDAEDGEGDSNQGDFGAQGQHPPVKVMDVAGLQQEDLLYITMTAPPKPSVVPGKDQMNKATRARMAVLEMRLQAEADGAIVAAAGGVVTGGRVGPPPASELLMAAAGGGDSGFGASPVDEVRRYVPRFLRSKREPVMPPMQRPGGGSLRAPQWEVPSFNSTTGFEAGMEAENGVVYYD